MSEARAAVRRVTCFPATRDRFTAMPITEIRKRRVAAYARVSTDSEEQDTSFVAQVEYYTDYINRRANWEFVEIYADDGITGTNTKKRDGFNRMIEDALAGKIDLIITKSISRFARNTVDTLTTIRILKEKGIGVIFEKENIDTLDSKSELLITIMSSLAQEESRSISENVTWGWRKRISDGKVSVAYSHFLGYEKGPDGKMQIVEEEAKVVREIYAMFLDGKTPFYIATVLTKRGIPTPAGKEEWGQNTVKSILTNEKYKGDALLQKTFTPNFLTKKAQINRGEAPQYYVENSHPAIVSPETFDLVQYEMERRQKRGSRTSAVSVFSNRVVCGECGAYFGSKVWHSTDAYRTVIWRCNKKYAQKGNPCASPHIRDEEIKEAFQQALNQMLEGREEIAAAHQQVIEIMTSTDKLDREMEKVQNKLDSLHLEMQGMVQRNAEVALDQDEYEKQYNALAAQYSATEERYVILKRKKTEILGRRKNMEAFATALNKIDNASNFDEHVFTATVEQVVVRSKEEKKEKSLTFVFKDGTEIAVK